MNRRVFWLGYGLALGALVWLLWRQRQGAFKDAAQRLREVRPDMIDWLPVEPVQEAAQGLVRRTQAVFKQQDDENVTPEKSDEADDFLQEINGIGPAFERRLKEAGIGRFAELAALSEDEVRERLALEPWQGDVESWIEQAKALAKK